MYKYKSFSLDNNPLLFLLDCEGLSLWMNLNRGGGAGGGDREVSMKRDGASVDGKKEPRREVFIPISYALSE